jgi:hypothetical protein
MDLASKQLVSFQNCQWIYVLLKSVWSAAMKYCSAIKNYMITMVLVSGIVSYSILLGLPLRIFLRPTLNYLRPRYSFPFSQCTSIYKYHSKSYSSSSQGQSTTKFTSSLFFMDTLMQQMKNPTPLSSPFMQIIVLEDQPNL